MGPRDAEVSQWPMAKRAEVALHPCNGWVGRSELALCPREDKVHKASALPSKLDYAPHGISRCSDRSKLHLQVETRMEAASLDLKGVRRVMKVI